MQRSSRLVLGIDAGTTSVKTVAFTLDGAIVTMARSSVRIDRDADGRAETNMDHIWDAATTTLSAVVEAIGDAEVIAIGVTGQGDGAWFVDQAGRPLGNAALWLDGRANGRLKQWQSDGRAAAVHRATGSPLFAGALPLLVDELNILSPANRATLGTQLNCKDWLRYRLTGRIGTDPSEASRTYLDTSTLDYSEEVLVELGQQDLRKHLPPVLRPESIAGGLDERVAAALGLLAGIPVVVGLVDTAAAGVGLGAVGDGQGYAILGTTGFVGVNHASRSMVRAEASIVLATGRGNQVLESMAPMTGTPNLDWIRAALGLEQSSWADIEAEAEHANPGSGGVIYLPYGSPSGERAPFFSADASASWLGMSVTTSQGELLRSVYEGLAYALTECLEVLGMDGPLLICGGGSDSDLLCGILADVSGFEVVRQDEPEVGARGVATLALVGIGMEPDIVSAAARMAPATSSFEPDPVRHVLYREAYTAFITTRDALQPQWAALRQLRISSGSHEPAPQDAVVATS